MRKHNVLSEISLFAAIALEMTVILFAASTYAQTPAKTKVAHKKKVSLDTILGCPSDDLIERVFDTTLGKMGQLDFVRMSRLYKQPLPDHPTDKDFAQTELRTTGFQSLPVKTGDVSEFSVIVTDLNGHSPDRATQPFCQRDVDAEYSQAESSALPDFIEIVSADQWMFNPNELFARADQFTFTSGAFSDSTAVFFSAKRGRVEIQFLSQPDGLKLYRIFVNRPGE